MVWRASSLNQNGRWQASSLNAEAVSPEIIAVNSGDPLYPGIGTVTISGTSLAGITALRFRSGSIILAQTIATIGSTFITFTPNFGSPKEIPYTDEFNTIFVDILTGAVVLDSFEVEVVLEPALADYTLFPVNALSLISTDESFLKNFTGLPDTGDQFILQNGYTVSATFYDLEYEVDEDGYITGRLASVAGPLGVPVNGIHWGRLSDPRTTTFVLDLDVADEVAPSGYTVVITEASISDVLGNTITVTANDLEVGTTYTYTITSSNGGTPLTESDEVLASPIVFTDLDVSSLPDGTLTFSLYLTDEEGNVGLTVSDTVIKFTDRLPNTITFNTQSSAALNSTITSNSQTIAGLTVGYSAPVTVTNGEWRKNGGAWETDPGSVVNGDTVEVRHTSSSSFSANTVTTLVIGEGTFTFTSTTIAEDTSPTAFVFTPQTNVALSSTATSNSITVAGINSTAAVSITNGEWRKNSGSWTASAGTVVNGDVVEVRHTSSASYNTLVSTVLTIGGVNGTFTSTTVQNSTPTAFTFVDQTGVQQNTVIVSAPVIITGITVAAAISVTNGEYSIDNGPWTVFAGTINNNQTVRVRHTSSIEPDTATNTVLTVGGVSDTFTSTTTQTDSIPDQFTFTTQSNVPLNTLVNSNLITVAGINTPTAISVINGEYSINGGSFSSSPSVVTNGQTVRVRHNTSTSYNTEVNTTLTIGGISATFTTITLAAIVDITPDQFSFVARTNVALNTYIISNAIVVTGINSASPISVINGEYSVNGGAFTNLASTVNLNDSVVVRHCSSFNYLTQISTQLIIGGIAATFSSTTLSVSTIEIPPNPIYTEDELIQYILDNRGNPPNTSFGLYTNALHVDSVLINYIANSPLVYELDDVVQLNDIHEKLLRHYIAGNALRGDNNAQNRVLGAEELSLYEAEIAKITDNAASNQAPDTEFKTPYNGIG